MARSRAVYASLGGRWSRPPGICVGVFLPRVARFSLTGTRVTRKQGDFVRAGPMLSAPFDHSWKQGASGGKVWIVDARKTGSQGLSGLCCLEVKGRP